MNKINRIARFLCAVVSGIALSCLFACCSTALSIPHAPASVPPSDELIVPGTRIDDVALGMTSKQLLSAEGSPGQSNRPFTTAAVYHFENNHLLVSVDDSTQQVWWVYVNSDSYHTKEGVEVGQSELEMRAALGNPDETSNIGNDEAPMYLNCYKSGLSVYILMGKITQIGVFVPGNPCR